MDREEAVQHLKALREKERKAVNAPRPYLSRKEDRARGMQAALNAAALELAICELEGFVVVDRLDCPDPVQQTDEYYCAACNLRWGIREDKPTCQRK